MKKENSNTSYSLIFIVSFYNYVYVKNISAFGPFVYLLIERKTYSFLQLNGERSKCTCRFPLIKNSIVTTSVKSSNIKYYCCSKYIEDSTERNVAYLYEVAIAFILFPRYTVIQTDNILRLLI